MRLSLLSIGMLAMGSAQAAGELNPQDFAYGMPIMATELAAAYRVQLPVDVYKVSVHDLGDVRVFNAAGEAVPYAIRRVDVPRETGPKQSLPLFPLPGDTVGSPGLKLTLASPDGAIQLQAAGHDPIQGPAAQYLLDARKIDAPIAALELTWPESSADYSGRIRLETSDDLSTWKGLLQAPIANLHAGGQQLVERRVAVPDIKAKFLRLIWVGSKPPFELTQVDAELAAGEPHINWSTVVVTGNKVAGSPDDFDFDLGARLPLERVNLALPEANSVYVVDFKSRPDEKSPWRQVAHAGVYRVSGAQGEQTNGPIDVPLDHDRYWRVHVSGGNGASLSLRLQGSFSPSELEFLAHGQPPFMLAYGSSSITGAPSDLSVLPAGTAISSASLGPRNSLGGEARISLARALLDQRSLLWSVLGVAVAVLAVMARRLMRDRVR